MTCHVRSTYYVTSVQLTLAFKAHLFTAASGTEEMEQFELCVS